MGYSLKQLRQHKCALCGKVCKVITDINHMHNLNQCLNHPIPQFQVLFITDKHMNSGKVEKLLPIFSKTVFFGKHGHHVLQIKEGTSCHQRSVQKPASVTVLGCNSLHIWKDTISAHTGFLEQPVLTSRLHQQNRQALQCYSSMDLWR